METALEMVEVSIAPVPLEEGADYSIGREPAMVCMVLDPQLRILHASRNLSLLLGLQSNIPELGSTFVDFVTAHFTPGQDGLASLERWASAAAAGCPQPKFEGERLLSIGGEGPTELRIDEAGDGCWLAFFSRRTAGNSSITAENSLSMRDHLTGIGNRRSFEVKLDHALARMHTSASVSLLFIDLDRFKAVNDTLGHAAGDALLRLVSERLTQSIRESDTVARLGGDEFAILLANPSSKEANAALAARIIDMVQRPFLVDGNVIHVGASIGLATGPGDGTTREALLKSADLALYYSKAAGRGTFHFFEPAMQERAEGRRALELDLRKALLLRQFELHYQPQIDVESGSVIGLEGLLRWRHAKRGLLLPGDFLSLAEELGLAVPIGEWVLKTACREATKWPDTVTVAVNISPLQFETGKLAQSVERALAAAGLPGKRLEIEVTENILLRDGQAVLATLKDLRALGVRVAMDRFGTGVASLSQLVNFPFDKIKIDRSLIALEQGDKRNRAIVRAISALGHSLGISTLAEGVETAEHLAHVRSEGCHSVQGFFYSKAVPSSELASLVPQLFTPAPSHTLSKGGA